jgi:hypothetical protein
MKTYFFSSIWIAWYHPIPLLGAPHPTRITSACPASAIKADEPLMARTEEERAPIRARKAALRARENDIAVLTVDARIVSFISDGY